MFDLTAFTPAQPGSSIVDHILDFDQGNTGTFNLAEGDTLDISALLSGGSGQPVGNLVRVLENASGTAAILQIDRDGVANGAHWTTIALLDGVHTGDGVKIVFDSSQPAATLTTQSSLAGVTVNGTAGNDVIDMTHTVAGQPFPTAGDDIINGGAGNDIIFGGLGNDIIDGGAGVDTAGYVGFSTQYSIGFHGQTVSGPEGFDQLTNIEIIQFADGRMVYDQGDAVAITYRMYDSAFGRAPDSAGLNGWTTALQKGLSVADMASGFAGSQEFVATYGSLDNQQFVEQLYRNVLDREGEATGVAGWTNALDTHAMSRGQVLAGFSESAEHVQKLAPVISEGIFDVNETAASVARLYDAAFNRLPDGNGLLGWKDAVDHGMSLSAVADGFASSAEFQNTHGNLSNQGFVEQLYHNVLDRAGDATGVAGWTAALASGQMDRGDVLLGFSESLEHQLKTADVIDHGIWIV